MIKRHSNLLLVVTAIFVAFTLGFFTGRNYNPSPVQIQNLSAESDASDSSNVLLLQAPKETESFEEISEETQIPTAPETLAPEITETEPTIAALTEAATTPATNVPTEAEKKTENPPATQIPTEVTTEAPAKAPTEAPAKAPTEAPEETKSEQTEPSDKKPDDSNNGLININTASAAQLMTLPGIGEVLSQRIVEYRETNGPFQSVAALTNVKGIGEKRLAAIINLVTV